MRLVAIAAATLLVACQRGASEPDADERPAPPPAIAQPAKASLPAARPVAPPYLPGALGVASEELASNTEFVALKVKGGAGEWLHGDVFAFRMLSMKTCGEPRQDPDVKRPGAVVAALVEIRAKSRLTISPRDVVLHRGGVTFYASVDPERNEKGCAPLLSIAALKQKQVAKGYVLFDVPAPDLKGLELSYRPTRWGGAGQVRVAVDPW